VVAGDRTVGGVTAVVQNASPYTYFSRRPIELADGAELEGGTLAAVVLRRANPLDMPTVLWRAFSRRARIPRHRQVDSFPDLREVTVRSADERPIPLQVDGDHVDDVAEAAYRIRPGVLLVVA
jgi:hypothetical protein